MTESRRRREVHVEELEGIFADEAEDERDRVAQVVEVHRLRRTYSERSRGP